MIIQALALGVLAGFGIWDTRVFGQSMLERPLVLCPITGLILGDPFTGIVMGASLELVMMGVISIGAATGGDPVTSGILATAFAILSGLEMEAAVALALPIATLGQAVGILDRTLNSFFARMADRAAAEGDYRGVERAMWGGAALFWVSYFVVVFLGVLLGSSVISAFVDALPQFVLDGLQVASGMLPALGIAILMELIFDKSNAAYLFLGFVLTAVLGVSVTAVAVVGVIIAYIIYQNGIKSRRAVEVSASAGPTDDLDGEL